ncbi:MAG TPA: cytosine permease [Baekduia sp.]|uniref:purine-cytosine permease family protein n=1 Tax=Baekduia sp. TaxID=2600305 RepID=UPI002C364D04|nr:cytosine permease [Baekduia sp.]HMJ36310.1 cytosine permease [Baekduia sp.]
MDNSAAVPGPAPQASADEIGRVEARGIDYVPERDRHSHPRDLAWAMFGPQFGFGNMVFGSLGIVFGLSWWSTFTAVTAGVALGSLIFTGVAIQSPKTGTNNAVSSGAFFGVRGRYLGSLISLVIGLAFFAILVWTAGQTIVVVFHRLIGTGTGDVALSIAMLVVSLLSFVLAIYGHATLVASFRFIAIASAGVSLLAVIVLAGKFHAVHGGSYLLEAYWPTWVLTMVLAALLPITWGPFIGDYGRYIPSGTNARTCALAAGLGIFAGCWLAEIVAAYATTTFEDPTTAFAIGFPAASPLWFAILLMIAPGGLANIESAAMCVYNAALDLQAVFWRLSRAQLTFVISAIGLAAAYVGLIGFNAIKSIEAFATLMLVTCTPWMVIMTIGHLLRHGWYEPNDLQAFAGGAKTGVYWFTGGFNVRAVVAWGAAVATGMLFASTSIITGPLTRHVSGIDLSFTSAAVVGGVLYYALVKIFPERGVMPIPRGGERGSTWRRGGVTLSG